ncbi:LacI family DNA-binding transcriptional regulator [Aquincola sp. MAHUQ-54]|uniref:LacI family DNA-binding transcriptional regulator n=1 Tax=Aquincola agrisoli TaxID=3119538 RepID=A0AAW9QH68_9BURK
MARPPRKPADPGPAETPPPGRRHRSRGGMTLSELAQIAGVSPMSASRALNAPALVSPAILAKVQAAVASTGYVANRVAGGLASRRSRLVAAVLPSLAGSVFEPMVQSLFVALAQSDYQLLLGQSGYGVQQDHRFLEALIGRRPDGLVLCGVVPSAEGARQLAAARLPVVETWDMVASPIDMVVGFSHESIARAVAEHLLRHGHRQFAFVGGDHERARRRGKAFASAIQAGGKSRNEPVSIVLETAPTPGTVRGGREALRRILARQPKTSAVFCSSDMLALGMVTEAQARGIAVPGQIAIVGFGDASFSADIRPALTTVRVDSEAIGRKAAHCIVERAEGREVANAVVDVGFSLIVRETA